MSFRVVWRTVALGVMIWWSFVLYFVERLRGPLSLEARARWAHFACCRALRALRIHTEVRGIPPRHGLVVANHLSYLDILILSAAMPCAFVSKVEIGSWPLFGTAARMCGTIFLNRSSMASAQTVAEIMTRRFEQKVPVLLFPEGTSTDGSEVLRFHSRLIDPATKTGTAITAAALRYVPDDGSAESALCWYGDVTFVPHLLKALNSGGFTAYIDFGEPVVYEDRRVAADATQAIVAGFRNGFKRSA